MAGFSDRSGTSLRGTRIEFVQEKLTFTGEDSPMANLMLSVMGAFAEFERALLRERQREGVALARQRGAYRGRKKTLSPEAAAELRRRRQSWPGAGIRRRQANPLPIPAHGRLTRLRGLSCPGTWKNKAARSVNTT